MRRRKPSWLDQWVYRFQHRWETNAQYRAAVAGVCGLLLIALMCSCTGILTTAANAGLASFGAGGGGSNSGGSNTGTKQLGGQSVFPTFTIPAYSVATIQAGNIPDSQTPGPTPTAPPAPTDAPTATPCQPNCGGGGGGGGAGTVTASWSPSPWVPGHTGYISVHTSQPSIQFGFIITLPNFNDTVEPAGTTDSHGDAIYAYQINSAVGSGTGHIVVLAQFNPVAYANIYPVCS
jgi:hypothetical protein